MIIKNGIIEAKGTCSFLSPLIHVFILPLRMAEPVDIPIVMFDIVHFPTQFYIIFPM